MARLRSADFSCSLRMRFALSWCLRKLSRGPSAPCNTGWYTGPLSLSISAATHAATSEVCSVRMYCTPCKVRRLHVSRPPLSLSLASFDDRTRHPTGMVHLLPTFRRTLRTPNRDEHLTPNGFGQALVGALLTQQWKRVEGYLRWLLGLYNFSLRARRNPLTLTCVSSESTLHGSTGLYNFITPREEGDANSTVLVASSSND